MIAQRIMDDVNVLSLQNVSIILLHLLDWKMQIAGVSEVAGEGHYSEDGYTAEEKVKRQISLAVSNKITSHVKRKKCIGEVARVQKVLEELSAKSATPEHVAAMRYKRQKITNDARMLLLEYAKELSSAILEESCLLAKHRSSKELIIADLKLIFGEYISFHECNKIRSYLMSAQYS